MITRVISGGQIGADIAGLRAAHKLGIETGGWAPKGYRIKDGFNPVLRDLYKLDEHESNQYKPRTFNNVGDSDITVRFAHNFNSPGEICTLNAIEFFKKPYTDIPIDITYETPIIYSSADLFGEWLNSNGWSVLNVAGNANKKIEDCVEKFLYQALRHHVAVQA